jgi:hypothetical protein
MLNSGLPGSPFLEKTSPVKDGLNELDPTHAIFSALGSFWWRLLVFFICFWLGHYVGLNALTGGEFLRNVWQNGLGALFEKGNLDPIWVPLSWFWTLIAGCSHPIGVLYLFLVGTAFLVVRLSEDHYHYAFFFALLAEPLHTIVVENHSGAGGGFDLAVLIIVLVTYEIVIGGLYWWYLRQLR